jgi:hypothetical protein
VVERLGIAKGDADFQFLDMAHAAVDDGVLGVHGLEPFISPCL